MSIYNKDVTGEPMDTTVTIRVNDFAPPEAVHATFSRDLALRYDIILYFQVK